MRTRDPDGTIQLSKIRLPERIRRLLERDARRKGTTINAVVAAALEAHYAETDYSGETGALGELLARAMSDAGKAITGINAVAGHGRRNWQDDPYAYGEAVKAAMRVLELARPYGEPAPHGEFTSGRLGELSGLLGEQVANGIIEQLTGRAAGTASHWTERVRNALGSIATRLCDKPPSEEFFKGEIDPNPRIDIRDGMIFVEPSEEQY
ncbi:MAG TPA: hypothetical protein VN808_05730 [Stellaceae bacterium]|nr:hypothetical protein [Stellaceae bacterium]